MNRDELRLRDRIKNLLEVYELEDILADNDMSVEDMLVYMVESYGLLLPDYGPLE